MQNNVLSTLGLVRRANKIVFGESIINHIRDHSVKLVIIAHDASDNTKKRLINKCKYYHVNYLIYSDSQSLSKATGREHNVAFGITDKGFANMLKDKIGG